MKQMMIGKRLVPAIGMGTWGLGESISSHAAEKRSLQEGLHLGARVIDTAEMYGDGLAEQLVGEVIQESKREDIYLISKFYPWHAGAQQLEASLHASLKRLKTDYLDLYLLHWRGNIPLTETIEILEACKKAGKIKQWGVSNFDIRDMKELYQLPQGDKCVTNQVLYNLGSRGIEFDLLPWMKEQQIPLIAYAPVAHGDTLGANLEKKKILRQIAGEHNGTVYQILLAWSIHNGTTLAIPKASQLEHMQDNMGALNLTLTENDLKELDRLYPAPKRKLPLAVL